MWLIYCEYKAFCDYSKIFLEGVLQKYRPPTVPDHWQPTQRQVLHQPTNNRQALHWPTDQRTPTHRQVLHRPLTTDSLTGIPPTHQPPTNDHRLTSRSSLPNHWSPTHENSYNRLPTLWLPKIYLRVTIGPIISIINFSLSFGMGTIYYGMCKIIYKMSSKNKNIDKSQILLIIPFGNWHLRIGI